MKEFINFFKHLDKDEKFIIVYPSIIFIIATIIVCIKL